MTRAERERRDRQREAHADRAVALLSEDYPYFLQLAPTRKDGSEDWPLEMYLCFSWSLWEPLIDRDIRELVKARFWDEGQRQIEQRRRAREERYGASYYCGA